jgi:hypothetical protein
MNYIQSKRKRDANYEVSRGASHMRKGPTPILLLLLLLLLY